MEPRISIITLGVSDMLTAVRFYRDGLGFETPCKETDPWVAFRTAGTRFTLYSKQGLAEDIAPGTPLSEGGFGGITLAYNARSKEEVDHVLDQAKTAGATLAKAPVTPPWGGYSGYFLDLDGYPWEVAWHEEWQFSEAGILYGGAFGPVPE